MSNALGDIFAGLGLKTTEWKKGIHDAERSLDGLAQSVQGIATIATVAFAGMATGLGVVTKFASGQQEAELKLAAAIRGTGQAIDIENIKSYAAELQKVTKFGDETTITAAAMLTTFQLNEEQIKGMLPRVQNLAALYGMDLKSAAIAVGKAMTSGAGALGRYGITLSEAEKKTFNLGTKTQKVALLMKVLDKNTGPAAKMLANTATGAFAQLTNAAGDLAEQLGFIVDSPIKTGLQTLTSLITKVVDFVTNASKETKTWLAKIALATTAITGLTAGLLGFVALYPMVKATFLAFSGGAAAVWAVAVPMLAVAGIIAGVILILGSLKKAWDGNLFGMRSSIKSWVSAMKLNWKDLVSFMQVAWKKATEWITDSALTAYAMLKGMSPEEAFNFKKAFSFDMQATDIGESIEDGFKAGASDVKLLAKDIISAFKEGAKVLGIDVDALLKKGDELATKINSAFTLKGGKKQDTPPGGGGGGTTTPAAITTSGNAVKDEGPIDDVQSALYNAGRKVASAAGDFGAVAMEAIQGFSKGPMTGLIGLGVNLLTRTKAFSTIAKILGEVLGVAVSVVEPLVRDLTPLIFSVGMLAKVVLPALIPVFEILTPILWVAFQVIRGVALIIAYVFKAIGTVWNGIIGFVQKILNGLDKAASKIGIDVFGDLSDKLQTWKVGMGGLDDAIDTLKNTGWDQAKSLEGTNEGLNDMNNNLADVNESLTNVPEGFKIALARFRATSGSGGSYAENIIAQGQGPGVGVTIENVNINGVTDGGAVWEQMKLAMAWDNFTNNGNETSNDNPSDGVE